jgi:hypothetical protein
VNGQIRKDRAFMLAHTWAHGLYPEHGDVKALTMALSESGEESGGIGVFGMAEVDALCEALLVALVGERRIAPAWLALTTTVYFDDMTPEEARNARPGPLGEFPTPTTRHGLMVLSVDLGGVHTAMWQVDLTVPPDPVLLPEKPEWESDEDARGLHVVTLRSLFEALVQVGGE